MATEFPLKKCLSIGGKKPEEALQSYRQALLCKPHLRYTQCKNRHGNYIWPVCLQHLEGFSVHRLCLYCCFKIDGYLKMCTPSGTVQILQLFLSKENFSFSNLKPFAQNCTHFLFKRNKTWENLFLYAYGKIFHFWAVHFYHYHNNYCICVHSR